MGFWVVTLLLLNVVALPQAARPSHYDYQPERRNYDSQWAFRSKEERQENYYKNPNAATIVRQSQFALEYRLGHKLQFLCVASGRPLPRITWLKDGLELMNHRNLVIHEWKLRAQKNKAKGDEASKNRLKSKLEIDPTTQGDQGIYTCVAENKYAVVEKRFKAEFLNI
ncbi:hypothetical protein BV898_11962 [Hypsibius exemplaris]|uniref:Ig-like domain-containing protein n=1 Tax=Hypsibius exemplaris TaxID=2072580 RepID=A0A1W0WF69_HYPEX|nr:hypothetical protein BV898_11962 [Hypsibius exemplaris]